MSVPHGAGSLGSPFARWCAAITCATVLAAGGAAVARSDDPPPGIPTTTSVVTSADVSTPSSTTPAPDAAVPRPDPAPVAPRIRKAAPAAQPAVRAAPAKPKASTQPKATPQAKVPARRRTVSRQPVSRQAIRQQTHVRAAPRIARRASAKPSGSRRKLRRKLVSHRVGSAHHLPRTTPTIAPTTSAVKRPAAARPQSAPTSKRTALGSTPAQRGTSVATYLAVVLCFLLFATGAGAAARSGRRAGAATAANASASQEIPAASVTPITQPLAEMKRGSLRAEVAPAPARLPMAPIAEEVVERCTVVWWRGYLRSQFLAVTPGAEDVAIVAESPMFNWRSRLPPPPDDPAAQRAHEHLTSLLSARGCTPESTGPEWFEATFRLDALAHADGTA